MNNQIVQWNDISTEFTDNLIVGNGGAIAAGGEAFKYDGLYEAARKQGILKEPVQEVFKQVAGQHPDFERVLYQLWLTDFINQRFELDKPQREKVRNGYTLVRRALIDTVKDIHPRLEGDVTKNVGRIGRFITRFSNVFYMNYDLLLDWACQAENNRFEHQTDDGFSLPVTANSKSSHVRLEFNPEFTRTDSYTWLHPELTRVFYPHGSLMLYQTPANREERKLTYHDSDILKRVTDFWAKNNAQPLFVCEGSSDEKKRSINGSKYLSHVFNQVLPEVRGSLVIFGWHMGEQDKHILEQLKHASVSKIAVSIYTHGKSAEKLKIEKTRICESLKDIVNEQQITFFDSENANCWCN